MVSIVLFSGLFLSNKVFYYTDEIGSAAKTLSNIVNNNSIKPKAATPLNNDLLQQFDAFNLNSSPAPSHHSGTSYHSNSKPNHDSQTALDAFADFDDFAATLATTGGSGAATTATTTGNTKLNNSFFDAFNDNFSVIQSSSVPTGVVRPNDQRAKAFDAFNDNFEDQFKTSPNANFAKFDGFEAHNFSSDFGNASFGTTGKEKQNGQVDKKFQSKEPVKDKFAADYSKPESFDADLEEALKRSVLDN